MAKLTYRRDGGKEKTMTREQAEQAIYEHMKAIKEIVTEYAPENIYISLTVYSDGTIFFNNTYWELPEEQKIDFAELEEVIK